MPNFINVLTQALAFLLHKHSSYNSVNIKPQIWSRSAFKVKKLKGYILQKRQITNPIAIMDISQEFGLTNEIFYKETFAAYITVYFLHVMTKLTHILLKYSSLGWKLIPALHQYTANNLYI